MRAKIILTLLFLFIIVIAVLFGIRKQHNPAKTDTSPPAVSSYDKYNYGRADEEKIVDFGTQPNSLASSFLKESLFHDRILQQQLAAEGWKLREHGYRSGNDMLPYADGRLDVMLLGDIPALIAMYNYKVEIIAVCRQGYNAIIAKSRITPTQLKGARIGYPLNTAAHFTVERALVSAGLSVDDVISINMKPDELESALQRSEVDAVAAWEPFLTSILNNVQGSFKISNSDTYTFIAIAPGFGVSHPTILKALLAATARATHWVKMDRENLSTNLLWISQGAIEFQGDTAIKADSQWIDLLSRETINNPSFPMLPLNFSDKQSLPYQQFEFLKKIGIIPDAAEWQKFTELVKMRLLSEIISDSKTWQINRFDYDQDNLYKSKKGLQ